MTVKIIENYISEKEAKEYYSYLDLHTRQGGKPEIINALGYSSSLEASKTSYETGAIHGKEDKVNKDIGGLFVRIKKTAEELFDQELDLHQASYQILLPGADNGLHADAVNLDGSPIQADGTPEELEWSGLLYLNDYGKDFTGGILNFPEFDLDFYPSTGCLVLFKGDLEHRHSVSTILSGERRNLVFFWSKRGNVSEKNFFENRHVV